jgi:hypothetical protein
MKYFIGGFLALCALITGFCIGASEYKNMLTEVKWTDIGILIVTFGGFVFAFFTYFQWFNGKRKEDAYLVAKKYVASIDEVEEYLHEFLFQYGHICPTPGLMIEQQDVSLKRIDHLHKVWDYLYQARRNLYKSHRELDFWNVSLDPEFLKHHEDVNKLLDDLSVISSVLNNQLFHFVNNDMKNMDEVIRGKKRFDELYTSIHNITKKRLSCGFKNMFEFGV